MSNRESYEMQCRLISRSPWFGLVPRLMDETCSQAKGMHVSMLKFKKGIITNHNNLYVNYDIQVIRKYTEEVRKCNKSNHRLSYWISLSKIYFSNFIPRDI